MKIRLLTDEDKKEICSWKYEGEYAIYNLPSYEQLKNAQSGFMNPQKEHQYRVFLIDNKVIGYINLAEKDTEVFVGIGVHPEFCNKGYGKEILREAVSISAELYPHKILCLEVRSWNKRAIKCYQSAGFTIDGEAYEKITPIGKGEFYRMIKTLPSHSDQ